MLIEILRYLPATLAISALAFVVARARAHDTHSRSGLRDLLWPRYQAGRVRANVGQLLLVVMLVLGMTVPWLSFSPVTLFALECVTAVLAAYLTVGAALALRCLTAIVRDSDISADPGANALSYILLWPLWYSVSSLR